MNVMKVNFYVLSIFAIIFMFVACEKNDGEKTTYDLSFAKTNYNITYRDWNKIKGGGIIPKFIPILEGNGDYEIISSDESTIMAEYTQFDGGSDFGSIALYPKKSGNATITVTDKLTGQSKVLNFTIYNAYISFTLFDIEPRVNIADEAQKIAIENDLKNKSSIPKRETYMFVQNSSSTLYKFASPEEMKKGEYIHVGNYSLEEQSGSYFFTFEFADETQKYRIDERSFTAPLLTFFGVDVNNETRLNFPAEKEYLLYEYFTDDYKTEYPDLASARIVYYLYLSGGGHEVDVPVKLLLEEQ